MTARDVVKSSFSNLSRHKVRTALSAVGVTVGILTIVTMVSLGVGVQREIVQAFSSAGLETVRVRPASEERSVFNQFSEPKRTVLITPELVEEVRARDDVIAAWPMVYVPYATNIGLRIGDGTARVYVGQPSRGVSEPFALSSAMIAGVDLSEDSRGEIVLTTRVLRALGYEEQAEFERLLGQDAALVIRAPRGDEETFGMQVVGVIDQPSMDDTGYPRAYVGLADMVALEAWWYNNPDILEHMGYDQLVIEARSLNDAVQIVDLLEERGLRVESTRMMLDMVNKAMAVLQTMLGSIGGLALLVASIGIANTMVMAVYERTREIGVLKAIGASPGDIRILFVVESALIGLVGGVVGIVGGWLLGLGLNEAILAYFEWQEIPVAGTFFVVTGWLVVLALGFATVVGVLAGLYPAARAARLDPLEALRYE